MTRRTVTARTCKCGAKILTGLDRDWLALDTHLDAQPLDALGEALAVLQGRRTFDLFQTRNHNSHGRYMEERNAWRIAHPWPSPPPIHAEHRCGSPLPAAPPTPPRAAADLEPVDHTAPF